MSTYAGQLQQIVGGFRQAGGRWPATSKEMAAWAYREGLWKPRPGEMIKQLAEHLSRALREEYYTDPQGRRVRTKHAARVRDEDGEQMMFWGDIRTESREHFENATKLRRHQIVGDCHQLKTDVDSFNDNRYPTEPIQLGLDFTNDVAELDAVLV